MAPRLVDGFSHQPWQRDIRRSLRFGCNFTRIAILTRSVLVPHDRYLARTVVTNIFTITVRAGHLRTSKSYSVSSFRTHQARKNLATERDFRVPSELDSHPCFDAKGFYRNSLHMPFFRSKISIAVCFQAAIYLSIGSTPTAQIDEERLARPEY